MFSFSFSLSKKKSKRSKYKFFWKSESHYKISTQNFFFVLFFKYFQSHFVDEKIKRSTKKKELIFFWIFVIFQNVYTMISDYFWYIKPWAQNLVLCRRWRIFDDNPKNETCRRMKILVMKNKIKLTS